MSFFLNPDWLNRPGPYAFKWDHFLFIALATIISIISAILLRKCQRKTIKIVLIAIWGTVVFIDVFKWTIFYILVFNNYPGYEFSLDRMLPLHSCSLFMYVMPFALFSKNRYVVTAANSFLVTVNMIMGYITLFVGFAGKNTSVFSFFGFHTLLYHALIFIAPLIMVVTGYYDLQRKDIKYGIVTFLMFAIVIWTFDAITGCDYMYIYDGHTFGVLKFIYENVHHLVWTLITITCYILTALITHYFIYFLKKHLQKTEANKDTI